MRLSIIQMLTSFTFSPPNTHQRLTTVTTMIDMKDVGHLDGTAPHLVIVPDISTNLHILREIKKGVS